MFQACQDVFVDYQLSLAGPGYPNQILTFLDQGGWRNFLSMAKPPESLI
jgi:hypothetical protein